MLSSTEAALPQALFDFLPVKLPDGQQAAAYCWHRDLATSPQTAQTRRPVCVALRSLSLQSLLRRGLSAPAWRQIMHDMTALQKLFAIDWMFKRGLKLPDSLLDAG